MYFRIQNKLNVNTNLHLNASRRVNHRIGFVQVNECWGALNLATAAAAGLHVVGGRLDDGRLIGLYDGLNLVALVFFFVERKEGADVDSPRCGWLM